MISKHSQNSHGEMFSKKMFFLLLSTLLPSVMTHSWMTCPKSFITTNGRGGNQHDECETDGSNAFITTVHAGDRLKVGWTSNNHAGGYVRLSLVKFGDHTGTNANTSFLHNVLKFVCYGHDQTKGPNNGDCVHPCNGRGGCEYQADRYDIERYDTTIAIPTNLEEGLYVLQAAMLVGNSRKPYWSCAKLRILKGNPSLNCHSDGEPLAYSCVRTGGPALDTHYLRVGAKKGDFCFNFDGTIGGIDDNLRDVPINIECDSRLTCDNSIYPDTCLRDHPSMNDIQDGNQPGCRYWNSLGAIPPTCFDDIQNRDEQGVDCGGMFCGPCPTTPSKVTPGKYFSSITQSNTYWSGGNGGQFHIKAEVSKNVTDEQCWQLILQYENPVHIESSPWGDGQLVRNNNQETIFIFERVIWKQNPSKGQTIDIYFTASNPKYHLPENNGQIIWSDDTTRLQSATKLQVFDDVSQCEIQHPNNN